MISTIHTSLAKKVRATVITFFLLLFFSPSALHGSTVLEQADSAYNAREFRTALSLYNKVLDTQGASSQLYYNIGNANYRVGNVGKAIIFYERALRLDPSNADARANLDYVNSTLRGLPEDGSSFLSNIHSNVVSFASPDSWGIVAFVLFLLTLGCVAFYLFATNTTLRKAGFFGGFIVLALFIYSFIIAWQTSDAQTRRDTAIVVRPNARLTSNPGTAKNRDEKTIAIPEGSKIEIIDSLATPNDPVTALWYNVVLNNNTQAWIDATDVEQI